MVLLILGVADEILEQRQVVAFHAKVGVRIDFQVAADFAFGVLIATEQMIGRAEVCMNAIIVRKPVGDGLKQRDGFLGFAEPEMRTRQIVPPGRIICLRRCRQIPDALAQRGRIRRRWRFAQYEFRHVRVSKPLLNHRFGIPDAGEGISACQKRSEEDQYEYLASHGVKRRYAG